MLPTFLVLVLLAAQPVCLLYTRSVMESAAAQTARLMITAEDEGVEAYEAFALRRLAAVPDVSIFHAGGPLSWDISCVRAGMGSSVEVGITGYVTPLPMLGVFARPFGSVNASGDVRLEARVAYEGRPSWLEGDYDSWISGWEEP